MRAQISDRQRRRPIKAGVAVQINALTGADEARAARASVSASRSAIASALPSWICVRTNLTPLSRQASRKLAFAQAVEREILVIL